MLVAMPDRGSVVMMVAMPFMSRTRDEGRRVGPRAVLPFPSHLFNGVMPVSVMLPVWLGCLVLAAQTAMARIRVVGGIVVVFIPVAMAVLGPGRAMPVPTVAVSVVAMG